MLLTWFKTKNRLSDAAAARHVLKREIGLGEQVYGAAGKAYASLATHLEELYPGNAAPVSFFMGPKASTVDAVLYPHLLYQLRSPVAAPELREQVSTPGAMHLFIGIFAAYTACSCF
jgi:hypothetical protein